MDGLVFLHLTTHLNPKHAQRQKICQIKETTISHYISAYRAEKGIFVETILQLVDCFSV
jgi:hypothetical protein